jgi:hypothetical protein
MAGDLAATGEALVLEKWARGGGATTWRVLNAAEQADVLAGLLRAGSRVLLYRLPRERVEGVASTSLTPAGQDLLAQLSVPADALLVLADDGQRPELAADFLTGAEEVPEWLEEHAGRSILMMRYPRVGEEIAEANVPDADGVIRPHPH